MVNKNTLGSLIAWTLFLPDTPLAVDQKIRRMTENERKFKRLYERS